MVERHMQERSDPRELPAYSPAEAAHYLDIPVSTVRYWSVGRDQIQPLIDPAQHGPLILSFANLVELHVLSAIRRKHRISMPKVRRALDYVQSALSLTRPLASRRFQTDGVDLFVDHYGHLINASEQGQMAMKEWLGAALVRVEWDSAGQPVRLFPYTRKEPADSAGLIMIDPSVSGGRAVIRGTRIAVEVIAERYKAGESIRELAQDYGRDPDEIEEAVRCELKIAA
jgi:uncharacterized protein (DUF433 family)